MIENNPEVIQQRLLEEESPSQNSFSQDNLDTPNPSSPLTWANWMAAAVEAAQRSTASNHSSVKEENMPDYLEGGWRYEGKEKPEPPRVCTKCQWVRTNMQMEETDRSEWCESCLEGKPGPGSVPSIYKVPKKESLDSDSVNQSIFG